MHICVCTDLDISSLLLATFLVVVFLIFQYVNEETELSLQCTPQNMEYCSATFEHKGFNLFLEEEETFSMNYRSSPNGYSKS